MAKKPIKSTAKSKAKSKVKSKKSVGRPLGVKDADELYKWFGQYKAWSKRTPVKKMDFKGKDADEVTYKIERPLTWVGFRVWTYKYKKVSNLDQYKANKDKAYDQYASIIRVISDEIYAHQYDGAATGIYSANLVARKLNIVEKTEVKTEVTIKETLIGFDND